MADLREALEQQFEAAEEGTLETPIERDIEVNDDPIQAENRSQEDSQEASGQEDRDEKGRFKSKAEASRQDNSNQELNADGQASNVADEFSEIKEIQRPTTFKKEFVPIWEKMAKGEALTPEESRKFAEYTAVTRENEFKNGVSIYRKEAESAKGLVEAMQPFLPELQKAGIHPVAWIQSLGRAHYMLANGTPQQKDQMFQQLARDYGVQLPQGSGEQQQYDPNYALMQELNALKSEVGQVRSWREQEETTRLMGEITQVASNTEKYPHFEALRIPMAQLLEQGGAKDLDDAYEKAKWNVPEVRELEIQKLVSKTQNQASRQQQVAKAKAVAVSPRSVTPNGVVATSDKKDRRSMLESQLDNFTGNRF